MLTGLLLIIGPIVLLAGFIGFEASGAAPTDWSDTAGTVAELGKNPGLVKTFLSIAVLGMLGGAAGLAGLNHSMSGGSGAHYARLGLLLYVIGITIGLAEYTLLIGIAGAADGQAGAETLFTASQAIGAGAATIWFVGLGVIGISIFVQKNLHTILAALIVIVGVIGTVVTRYDYTSDLIGVPFLGSVVVTIATGALFLRSKS
jgi:hypothetical protein